MIGTETVIITGVLEKFLQRANRRHLTNLVLEYVSAAAGAGAIGAILLLILGTQVMNWYWPVLLFVAALGAGLYRARTKRLSPYRLAQIVDSRLGLQDRVSTLVFFRESGSAESGQIETVERQTLERLHPEHLRQAIPVNFPKYGYACAALAMAAGGLLAIRYGVLHTMSLDRPLARFDLGLFQPEPKAYAATKKTAIQERWEQQLKQLGITPQDMESPDEKGLAPTETQVPAGPDPDAAPSEQKGTKNNMKAPAPGGEDGEKTEGGEKSDGQPGENASGDTGSDQKGGQPSKQQNQPENAKNGQAGSQDGLMNKMRDALANLLNKMKSPAQQEQQTAQNSPSQQQQQNGKQQQQSQQGMQSQGKQQGEGAPSQDQQGADQNGEKASGDKSKSGEKSGDRPGQQDAKSGMGQQDGEKAIREAQQLAAMGKLSEIIGKRAQQITGEMTVEVSSGKQQLKTQWSEKKALHADTGAEVNRDEIPLAYQTYIQRYFEEVRKTPGGKSKKDVTP